MRTISSAQNVALVAMAKTFKWRLFVDKTGSGSYQDMTNFNGYDWCLSATYEENIDQPVTTASFKLARSVFDINLSPLMGNSKANDTYPILYPGRRVYLETATIAYGTPVQSGDWMRVFDGYIDVVDPHEDIIDLQCRDLGALVVDTFIETQVSYGSGTALQTVLQSILDDNINTPALGSVTLYVPSAPSFLVNAYPQQKQTVMEALQTLANLIGWDVRYKWKAAASAFALTLWTPDRANTTAARTFGPSDYYELTALKIDRMDIRNAIQIVYTDASSHTRGRIITTDSTSIGPPNSFGRRFMEITENAASQIDSSTKATNMVAAALSDLSLPTADHGVMMDYFAFAELGDLYAFDPNYRCYDSQQKLAVVQITHELSSDGPCHTTLLCRGKPATGYRRWLRIEGRPGIAPGANYKDPSTPTGISIDQSLGQLTLTYAPPVLPKWAKTNIYISTTSGNVADPGQDANLKNKPISSTYLGATGRMTKFTLQGLTPSTVYYVRVQVEDIDGNLSPVSALQTCRPEQVGPFHQNPEGAQAILNPNHDFNIFTKCDPATGAPLTFPDCWGNMSVSDTWASNSTYYDTSSQQSGKYCLYLSTGQGQGSSFANGSGIRTADPLTPSTVNYIPVSGGDILVCGAWVKFPSPLPNSFTEISANLWVWFWTGAKVHITDTGVALASSGDAPALNTWYLGAQLTANIPTNARYATLFFTRYGTNGVQGLSVSPWGTGTPAPGIYIDRITMTRGEPQASSYPSTAGTLTTGSGSNYPVATWDGTNVLTYGWDAPGDVALSEWVCNIAHICDVHWNAQVEFTANGTQFQYWIDYYDPVTTLWSQQSQNILFGDNGLVTFVELSARVDVAVDGVIRIMCISNHNVLIHYDYDRLDLNCVMRRDRS